MDPQQAAPPVPVMAENKWSAADDTMLRDTIQNGGELDRIAKSMRKTPRELEQRWQQLLFDENVAAQMPSSLVSPTGPKRVLWSEVEEETLLREASASDFKGFLALLENPAFRPVFHSSRTAKSIETHYYRMKSRAKEKNAGIAEGGKVSLEESEKVEKEKTEGEDANGTVLLAEVDFSDMEEQMTDELAATPMVMDKNATRTYKKELQKVDRVQQRTVMQLEKEVDRDKEKDRDMHTLALLRGRRVRHLMRTKELVIGRASPSTSTAGAVVGEVSQPSVDVDMWEEGDASKVSRQQAVLKLKRDCEFYIKNVSTTRPLLINGRLVQPGKKRRVADGSVIECGRLELLFEVNKPLLGRVKRQLQA